MEKKTSTDRVRAFRERKKANKPPRKLPTSSLERSREYRARQRALKKYGGQHNLPTTSNTLDESIPSLSEDTDSAGLKVESFSEVWIKSEPADAYEEENKWMDEPQEKTQEWDIDAIKVEPSVELTTEECNRSPEQIHFNHEKEPNVTLSICEGIHPR